MTNSATFWAVLGVVLSPVLLVVGLFCTLMPAINFVLAPAWTLVAVGYVGAFSNEIERCRRLARPATEDSPWRRHRDLVAAHP
ncbi:MAG: hypothetical protein EPO40_38185 [Myxococcaceae bacterium]|nr:MAG: hypothetical protein EPO40_38185 [Myxococcaceae bacterium]